MAPTVDDQELQRAYQRVNWVFRDKLAAMAVVASAAARLPRATTAQLDRKRKRTQIVGVDTRSPYRMLLQPSHLFEFLVLYDLERAEVRQELGNPELSQEDLLKRFPKYFIKEAMNHTPFYAAMGMCRGLCAYKSTETLRLYMDVAPDDWRKGDRDCSRVKAQLANRAVNRFARIAQVEKTGSPQQPYRLKRVTPSIAQLRLVKEGLETFSPTGLPRLAAPLNMPLLFSPDPDLAALQRALLFLDVPSFDILTAHRGVKPFDEQARIPIICDSSRDKEDGWDQSPFDMSTLKVMIETETDKWHRIAQEPLRLRVDGTDEAVLERGSDPSRLSLKQAASVAEVVSQVDGEDVVVATYVLTYAMPKSERWEVQLPWPGERVVCKFEFGEDDSVGATVRREIVKSQSRAQSQSQRSETNNPTELDKILYGTLQNYSIIRELASGQFGRTYIAKSLNTNREVVIKIPRVPPSLSLGEQLEFLQSLHSELALEALPLKRLKQVRGVAHLLDYGISRSNLNDPNETFVIFLAHEYIHGHSLDHHLLLNFAQPNGTFVGIRRPRDYFRWALALTKGLRAIHRAQVIHGDIWRKNIIVNNSGRAIYIDLAQGWLNDRLLPSHPQMFDHKYFPGRRVERSVSADIYGLGGVLFYLATGEDPPDVAVDSDTLKATLSARLQERNPVLYRDNRGVADVISRCLRANPAERCPNTDVLLNDITNFAPLKTIRSDPRRFTSLARELRRRDSGILSDIIDRQMHRILEHTTDMLHDRYRAYGDHEAIVSMMCGCLQSLNRHDAYLAISIPEFWNAHNLGVNGRFLSMNVLAAKRRATIRRVFLLIPGDFSRPDVVAVLAAQLRTSHELQADERVQIDDPTIMAGGYYVGFVMVTSEQRSELLADGRHFELIYKGQSGVFAAPTYDRGRITAINFERSSGRVDDSRMFFEDLLTKSKPLSEIETWLSGLDMKLSSVPRLSGHSEPAQLDKNYGPFELEPSRSIVSRTASRMESLSRNPKANVADPRYLGSIQGTLESRDLLRQDRPLVQRIHARLQQKGGEDAFEYYELVEQISQKLTELERRTWLELLSGKSIIEIAQEEHVARGRIYDRVRRMVRKNQYVATWWDLKRRNDQRTLPR
jgi:serine/threonine protein kinase